MEQYGLSDGPEQQARDEMWSRNLPEVTRSMRDVVVPRSDMNAVYGSPEFSSWVYTYDTGKALREYFAEEADRANLM